MEVNIMTKNWKIAAILYFALVMILLLPSQACAYIDPSTTTYIIQAVAGVVVAIGAFISIYWRKAKKKIANKLNIDENAKKEVEADIQYDDDDDE